MAIAVQVSREWRSFVHVDDLCLPKSATVAGELDPAAIVGAWLPAEGQPAGCTIFRARPLGLFDYMDFGDAVTTKDRSAIVARHIEIDGKPLADLLDALPPQLITPLIALVLRLSRGPVDPLGG